MCNYRPISILPILSKVIEKVVASQLMEHLEDQELLHPQQFGFRAGYSTEIANCCFVENAKKIPGWGQGSRGYIHGPKKSF